MGGLEALDSPQTEDMLLPVTLPALLVATSAPYNSSPTTCGQQPCRPPNRCEPRGLGVNVCVLPSPPSCVSTFCRVGYECVLQQETCDTRPCQPTPTCIRINTSPCGPCFAPVEFCELRPSSGVSSTCRFVVEPRCDNMVCPAGRRCESAEGPLCIRAPCPVSIVCR